MTGSTKGRVGESLQVSENEVPRIQFSLAPKKILFTEATSLSARQTLYALGGHHMIDVMDPSGMSQCRFSSLVRRWFRCPHYAREPEAFLQELVERLSAEDYDVLLPTHEQTILLSRYRESLGERVGLALPAFDDVETMQDKGEFMRLLTQLGIPIPKTDFVRTKEEIDDAVQNDWDFPFYLKQAHSTAGAGVFRVEFNSELAELLKRLSREGLLNGHSEWLLQRPAVGVMSTVKAVFDQGRLVGGGMYEARLQGLGGMSPARISADHPGVLGHVAVIGEALRWHGGMFLDYFSDATTGNVQYLEGNPRIGETVNPTLGGVNLAERLVRVSLGEKLPTQTTEESSTRVGVRTESFYMILISKAHAGAGRMELIRELSLKLRRRGMYADSQDELTRPGDDWMSVLPLIWICLQLFLWPGRSRAIVRQTIDNYSLPESAIGHVRELQPNLVEKYWAETEPSELG